MNKNMQRTKFFVIGWLLLFAVSASAVVQNGGAIIEAFIAQYKRPITILEIGARTAPYDYSFTKRHPGTHVVMLQEGAERVVSNIIKDGITTVAVLSPEEIDNHMLEKLGHCEHFDVVIVHDLAELGSRNIFSVMNWLLKLGNHFFIEVPHKLLERFPEALPKPEVVAMCKQEALCYFNVERTDLRLPRWDAPFNAKRDYKIQSNFLEKSLYKPLTGTSAAWIPGINLITFVMMRGIYPTDKMIRKQLNALEHIQHNDLVVGNIVVQGSRIAPIDFGDKRRNADINLHVKAALKVFRFGRRFRDPVKTLRMYREYVAKHR